MGARRLALILGSFTWCVSVPALAQAPGDGSDSGGEIEMEGDQPTPPPDQPTPPPDQPTEPTQPQQPSEPAPVVKDPKVAKKWLQAATQLVKKGDQLAKKNDAAGAKTQYDLAITAYQKSIEVSEDAAAVPVLFELAVTEDKAGSTLDSLTHLKVVLAAQGQKPDLMKKAQAKLDEVSMKVGIVTLTITPAGAQILINDKESGESPLPAPLTLMPGTYTVSLTAGGYLSKDIELKVEAGSESERKIDLEPKPIVKQPAYVEPEKPKTVFVPSKLPLYIGGGATVALALTATVTGILAVSEHGTFTSPDSNSPERKDAQVAGKNLAMVTDICLGTAVAAGAFTAYWYMFRYKPAARAYEDRDKPAPTGPHDESASVEPKINVAPWVQPQVGGLAVFGQF